MRGLTKLCGVCYKIDDKIGGKGAQLASENYIIEGHPALFLLYSFFVL